MAGYADALGLRPQSGVSLLSSPEALAAEEAAAARAGGAGGRQQNYQSAIAGGLASLAPDPQPAAGAAVGGASGGAGGYPGGETYGDGYSGAPSGGPLSEGAQAALMAGAQELGMDPRDLATIISYETGGKFDPNILGGMNADGSGKGTFMGLIQFDQANQQRYGLKRGMTFEQQMPAVVQYFKDRGYRPGMDLAHAYAIVNHGSLLPDGSIRNISDVNGNISEHVARMMKSHGGRARGAVPMAFGGGGMHDRSFGGTDYPQGPGGEGAPAGSNLAEAMPELAGAEGVDPRLIETANLAAEYARRQGVGLSVGEGGGARSQADQDYLYAQGRTRPGSIITKTRKSRHIQPEGSYSRALDLIPTVNGQPAFNANYANPADYDVITAAMKRARQELGSRVKSGPSWDRPHWELY
jgi:hypothetical protein